MTIITNVIPDIDLLDVPENTSITVLNKHTNDVEVKVTHENEETLLNFIVEVWGIQEYDIIN